MGPPPPKKTGPATFEEMGIPAGKNDSECVSVRNPWNLESGLTRL